MQIETQITLVSGVYGTKVGLSSGPEAMTPVEREKLGAFGEPTVAIGGSFTVPDVSPALTFTFPAADYRFPSEFPMTRKFGITDYDTAARANAAAVYYNQQMVARITNAVTAVVNTDPGVTGQDIQNIQTYPAAP
jgi:hypothetical protein